MSRSDLLPGTTVLPLENDRYYVVRLPAECSIEDVDHIAATLARLRSADPEHAPRFVVCRHDVEIELAPDE
jgi:hypothetical protein